MKLTEEEKRVREEQGKNSPILSRMKAMKPGEYQSFDVERRRTVRIIASQINRILGWEMRTKDFGDEILVRRLK